MILCERGDSTSSKRMDSSIQSRIRVGISERLHHFVRQSDFRISLTEVSQWAPKMSHSTSKRTKTGVFLPRCFRLRSQFFDRFFGPNEWMKQFLCASSVNFWPKFHCNPRWYNAVYSLEQPISAYQYKLNIDIFFTCIDSCAFCISSCTVYHTGCLDSERCFTWYFQQVMWHVSAYELISHFVISFVYRYGWCCSQKGLN